MTILQPTRLNGNTSEPRAAYAEMLDGCRRDPENRIWYAPWEMTLKDSRERVGEIGFLAGKQRSTQRMTARLSAGSASRASDRINIDFISEMYNTPPRFPLLLGTGAVYCIYARRLYVTKQ